MNHAKARTRRAGARARDQGSYGRDHPKVASALMDLGSAYGALGDYAKKRDMLERALAIRTGTAATTTSGQHADLGRLTASSATQPKSARRAGARAPIFERADGPAECRATHAEQPR